jgi:hypothetical protein
MFKPVKIYYESLLDIDPNVQEHTCRDEYWKLSDSKKTEYIKMSEKKYEIYAVSTPILSIYQFELTIIKNFTC